MSAPIQLDPAAALLIVIDIQEKLMPHIHEHERVVRRARLMLQAAEIIGIPVIVSEQYKKGFSETLEEIRDALPAGTQCYEKLHFGCFADEQLAAAIKAIGRTQLVLIGVEAHVCLFQTALKGLAAGYTVFIAEDATGSRRATDRETALRRMQQAGAIPASVEMLIMEALVVAGTPQFKAVLPLIREL